jgi:hypothetical protein
MASRERAPVEKKIDASNRVLVLTLLLYVSDAFGHASSALVALLFGRVINMT